MKVLRTVATVATLAVAGSVPWAAACAASPPDNEAEAALFEVACASCHSEGGNGRTPGVALLRKLSPRAIIASLEDGVIQAEGSNLTPEQRVRLAEYLTGRVYAAEMLPETAFCARSGWAAPDLGAISSMGFGGNLEATGLQSTELAGLRADDVPNLRLRWAFAFRDLRERWLAHLDDTRMRPLLLVDEAQELPDAVFAEIRLLAATDFDSRAILSVVFAGDNRLVARMRRPDLRPIASRIRQRLVMGPAEPEELARLLEHLLDEAGNPALMSTALKDTLVVHAAGNPRALTVMADALLAAAAEDERDVLDEKLFLDTWGEPPKRRTARR